MKAAMLTRLSKRFGGVAPTHVEFWDRYNLRWKGTILTLAPEQPANRKRICIPTADWRRVAQSTEDASYGAHDPKYSKLQQRLNCTLEKLRESPGKFTDTEKARQEMEANRCAKELALLDAKDRLTPRWMDERSFTDAVRLACYELDGDFFRKLAGILKSPSAAVQHDKLALLLLDNYIRGTPPNGIFLALFSDTALTDLAQAVIGRKNANAESLKKTRQRLALPKLPRPPIRWVESKGDHLVLVSVPQ